MINAFAETNKEDLHTLYKARLRGEKDGLRPKNFDPYIEQVQKITQLPFAVAWKMVDDMFLQEVAKRYFSDTELEGE